MRTGQPAYDAGIRGKEKPKEKGMERPKDTGKQPIRRISIEAASNGGHIVSVERHPKPVKANEPMQFEGEEKHAHGNKQEAHAHVGELMDQMSPGPNKEKLSSRG
jgi:hypothetical protein